MATDMSTRRLRREYMAISKSPIEHIQTAPLEQNILEWHYCLTGAKGSPYEGGYYHGKLKFPPAYPLKPPSVMMLTPNGRFHCGRRLCLSMSDFHPESWNPMWSVSTILMGLYSFMLESAPTVGSMSSSEEQKRALANQSLSYNCKDATFRKLFPELVEHWERTRGDEVASGEEGSQGRTNYAGTEHQMQSAWGLTWGLMACLAVLASMLLMLYLK
ncbi:unnamed protein product [Chrysoparadoxa australica]